MAIKGQKFKKYSSKLKEQILREYFDEGKSPSYLSSKYGISKYTITG
jgi:transposase-like protein